MEYTVYLRTNLINGKQYVGQTKNIRTRENDWRCLKARYANKILTEEREKYGVNNFKTDILAECETQEEAWELEQKYIAELGTKYPAGYNQSDGGEKSNKGVKGNHNGHEFEKGHTPWNKGIKDLHLSPDTEFVGIPIVQVKDGKIVNEYPSMISARKDGFYTSAIAACCKGKRKTHGGFQWYYKEDYEALKKG